MSGSTEWRTPPAVFDALHREFRFNVDAAANKENALVGKWCDRDKLCASDHHKGYGCGRFYTAETDGTKPEHYQQGDRVWINPPYSPNSVLYRFVQTAALTAREQGALWVMLLNATTTDTRWFHEFIWDRRLHRPREGVEVRFIKGRIAFHSVLNTPIPSPRYSNMIVVFHPREQSA